MRERRAVGAADNASQPDWSVKEEAINQSKHPKIFSGGEARTI
jgi:hypothetical protein